MKKLIIFLFIVLLGLSWYTAVSETIGNPKKEDAHLAKAAELEGKGIFVDAITEYEEALEYDPSNAEIRMKMANAYLQCENIKKYLAVCQQTAEMCQDNVSAMDALMNYYIENNSKSKAVKYLKQFIKDYPDNQNAQKWFLELKGSYIELYCKAEEMSNIFNDSMVILQGGKHGLLDAEGREMIASKYEEIHPFSEDGFALAIRANGDYVYIDQDGQTRMVPDKEYQNLGMMSSERAVASHNGKYGYLNRDMEPVDEFVWENITGIRNGIGAGKKNGKWALINKDGKEKTEFLYDNVVMDENGFCSGQKRIFVQENGKYHIVNQKGKTIGDEFFEDAKAFNENGYAAVCKNGKWGFVDHEGEIIIECIYEDAQSFRNGFAAVSKDGLWGYIDTEGNLVVEPVFSVATSLSEKGTAAVRQKGEDGEEWKLIQFHLFS